MSGCSGRQKQPPCYTKGATGATGSNSQDCGCPSKKPESIKGTGSRSSQAEKGKSKLSFKNGENLEGRCGSKTQPEQAPRRKKSCAPPAAPPCGPVGSREAIKRLSKIPVKDCECADAKQKKSAPKEVRLFEKTLPPECIDKYKAAKIELPRKPDLTSEQIGSLLEQEAKDVQSAWMLTSEARESYKKPCPKQQKAKDAVKAMSEPTKGEGLTCPFDSLPPLVDPEPDDISPEIAANMMYTQERGIKMISCPEETVQHLFSDQIGPPVAPAEKKAPEPVEDVDAEEGVNDAVYTRSQSRRGTEEGEESEDQDENGRPYAKKGEFLLEEKETKCINKVQLRGNLAPWFPGYYMAFPDQGDDQSIQLAKSPSGIFQRAWMAAKPSNIPCTDLYLVE